MKELNSKDLSFVNGAGCPIKEGIADLIDALADWIEPK
jgi:hypothetical protein